MILAELNLLDLFTGANDEPAPTPEAPARGEPLLNDYELDSSHQFFDRFQNDQFADDSKLFEALGAFQQEPAPNFHGVASSLGPPVAQDSSHSRALSFGHFDNDLHMRLDQANLNSPHQDHFSAPNALHFSSEDFAALDTDRSPHSRHYSDAFDAQNTFDQPPPTVSRSRFSRQSAPALSHGSLNFGDQAFGSTSAIRSPGQQGTQVSSGMSTGTHTIAPALGFGSDHNFRNQTYAAPLPNLEDLKSAEENIQAHMHLLEEVQQQSAETTAPSSPVTTKSKRRLSEAEGGVVRTGSIVRKSHGSNVANSAVGDKRQRKVKVEDDGEDDDDDGDEDEITASTKPQISRKSRQGSKARAGSHNTLGQPGRRRSQVGEKPPRQNLTEEEKKQNHIRSEQKRRNQIKDGFTNLVGLMPTDVPAGTSKCAILSQAVDWLHDLIHGNEKLRAQLHDMGEG